MPAICGAICEDCWPACQLYHSMVKLADSFKVSYKTREDADMVCWRDSEYDSLGVLDVLEGDVTLSQNGLNEPGQRDGVNETYSNSVW